MMQFLIKKTKKKIFPKKNGKSDIYFLANGILFGVLRDHSCLMASTGDNFEALSAG